MKTFIIATVILVLIGAFLIIDTKFVDDRCEALLEMINSLSEKEDDCFNESNFDQLRRLEEEWKNGLWIIDLTVYGEYIEAVEHSLIAVKRAIEAKNYSAFLQKKSEVIIALEKIKQVNQLNPSVFAEISSAKEFSASHRTIPTRLNTFI